MQLQKKFPRGEALRLPLLLLILIGGLAAGPLLGQSMTLTNRVGNTTLAMPPSPPAFGYITTNAYGNLSFSHPVDIVTPPGETNRLFVIEQDGRIAVITNLASPNRTVFADLTDRVQYDGSEEGLLSIAFHPGYATNRYFFVWYTTKGTLMDRLSRFQIDPANTNRALTNTELILISQPDNAPNHNGGKLLFGPEGYLYFTVGDEGHDPAWYENVQKIDHDFFSGIFRIDVDKRPGNPAPTPHLANTNNPQGTFNYAVPADNPFVGATSFNGLAVNPNNVRTEFWALGLRNPWRIWFDSDTGLLYCGDVGQNDREEVDIIVKGGNYGWRFREGNLVYNGFGTPPAGFSPIAPIAEYLHGSGTNRGDSITGGVVYRGDRFPDLEGAYIFSDYVSGNIWMLRYTNGAATVPFTRIAGNQGVVSFGIDPANGDVLLVDYFQNRIKRLIRASATGPALPATLADTGAFSSLTSLTPNPGILPYEINLPFWSDNGHKTRWFSVPDTNQVITYSATNNWGFPTGTVWIKHFDLQLTNGVPASSRRLETRFLVRYSEGVYGLTYRWGNSTNNATLVAEEGMDENFVINDGGVIRTQVWHYPSRSECLRCHTLQGGQALGFGTAQLNHSFTNNGVSDNLLQALARVGYITPAPADPATLPALSTATNQAIALEHRVKSYLAANCVHCHQPGGTALGTWDARFSTPLDQARILEGDLANNLGDVDARVIVPGSLEHSMLYRRVAVMGANHMPPLATALLNQQAVDLLAEWILGLGTTLPTLQANLTVGGTVTLYFTGATNLNYRIQYTDSFFPVQWQDLGAPTLSNGVYRLTDTPPPSTTRRYYRSISP